MEVHLVVNSNVFYILFAINKSFSACFLARIAQTAVDIGAYFHVRAFEKASLPV